MKYAANSEKSDSAISKPDRNWFLTAHQLSCHAKSFRFRHIASHLSACTRVRIILLSVENSMHPVHIAMLIISGFAFLAAYVVHLRNKRMDAEWAELEMADKEKADRENL
jgi:hypothetical protein